MSKEKTSVKSRERHEKPARPLARPPVEPVVNYPRKYHLLALAGLLGLVFLVFSDTLFSPSQKVLSAMGTDISHQFLSWRQFGFGQLRHANLALWNPHIYGGTPFMGGFQSALLYPPNWIFIFVPIAAALNLSIALNLFLAGAFTYLWAASRGLHPLGALLAGVIYMFGGAHFLHVFAGHLPNLCTMAWAPLLFFALDSLFDRPGPLWWLVGMLAVTMQILAGHPQYVFYTALTAALYTGLHMVRSPKRLQLALGFFAIYAGATLLSAAQLLTGFDAQSESVRSGNLPYDFVASYSFPPENLMTLLAPGFFGDLLRFPYWGRWLMWETNVYIGITGIVLAAWGAFHGRLRAKWAYLAMVALTFVLALGHYTPLFRLLYSVVPGFNKFRGNSKFIFLTAMFLAMLAAAGMDQLLRDKIFRRRLSLATLALALLLGAGAMLVYHSAHNRGMLWRFMIWVTFQAEGILTQGQTAVTDDAGFPLKAANASTVHLGIAALVTLLLSVLLYLRRFTPKAAYAVAVLGIMELFVFDRLLRPTFPVSAVENQAVTKFLDEHPGDYRILKLDRDRNLAMSIGAYDIWGYDPMIQRRYAELIAFTQGIPPDQATQDVAFDHPKHPLFDLLRCRYAFRPVEESAPQQVERVEPNQVQTIDVLQMPNALGHLQLVQEYAVVPGRDEMFAQMMAPGFDARRKVLLETPPDPAPRPGPEPGTARIVRQSTDWLEIEADLPQPAILLVTDAYSRNWRARPLQGSAQEHYTLQPADYALRAVALGAGHHHLRMEYAPRAFRVGVAISLLSLGGYAGLGAWLWRSRKRRPTSKPHAPADAPVHP